MDLNKVRELNNSFLTSFLSREQGLLFNLNSKDLIKFIPDNFVQTIYFDPPFSNNHMNDIPHEEDRKTGDYEKFVWFIDNEKSFLENCENYLEEFKRILKDSGSVFLHLPWDLAYDVKPIADKIFGGPEYLKNEIIWVFRRWSTNTNSLQENHHTILWYVKNPKATTFIKPTMPRTKETLKRFGDGKIVSAVDKETGRRVPAKTDGKSTETALNDVWVWDDSKNNWLYELDELDEVKNISSLRNIWGISHTAPIKKTKMIGTDNAYPFEKPAALLQRLIQMTTTSNADIVLDFFAGTGVTAEAALKLDRKYIINEISKYTTLDIIKRINYKKLVPGFPLYSHPSTIEVNLKEISGKDFEFWSGYTLGGISDDSYRGKDSFHGLDVVIPNSKDSFVPGEVKKELTLKDEWYKLSSKAQKLLEEHPEFGKTYAVVSTKISRDILHEMSKQKSIEYLPVALESSDKKHLLTDDKVTALYKIAKIKEIEKVAETELKKNARVKNKKQKSVK